jgi:hypothetical protein
LAERLRRLGYTVELVRPGESGEAPAPDLELELEQLPAADALARAEAFGHAYPDGEIFLAPGVCTPETAAGFEPCPSLAARLRAVLGFTRRSSPPAPVDPRATAALTSTTQAAAALPPSDLPAVLRPEAAAPVAAAPLAAQPAQSYASEAETAAPGIEGTVAPATEEAVAPYVEAPPARRAEAVPTAAVQAAAGPSPPTASDAATEKPAEAPVAEAAPAAAGAGARYVPSFGRYGVADNGYAVALSPADWRTVGSPRLRKWAVGVVAVAATAALVAAGWLAISPQPAAPLSVIQVQRSSQIEQQIPFGPVTIRNFAAPTPVAQPRRLAPSTLTSQPSAAAKPRSRASADQRGAEDVTVRHFAANQPPPSSPQRPMRQISDH